MDFGKLLIERRSCRKFLPKLIDADMVGQLIKAALLSPSSRNRRAWHFVVVDDKADLEKLADAKESGSAFLKDVPLAVVVMADSMATDCCVEDCSIAAVTLQYQAHALGLASCWVQIRGRRLSDGTPSADVVRGILDIPENMEVVCIIGVGYPATQASPHDEDDLLWEQVHIDKY